jgi:hypothetical protein
MTRVIEHRQDASPGEEVFELRVYQARNRQIRACVIPADMPLDHAMMEDMSEPAGEAFLDALDLCEKEEIAVLWVHDRLGLFPPRARPRRDRQG